jgi:hypothetical protein
MQTEQAEALAIMALLNAGGRPAAALPRKMRKRRVSNPTKCICTGDRNGFCKRHRAYLRNGVKDR